MTPYKNYELYSWLLKEEMDFYEKDCDKFKAAFHTHKEEIKKD